MALIKPSDLFFGATIVTKGSQVNDLSYSYVSSIGSNIHIYANTSYRLWKDGYTVSTEYQYNFDPYGGVIYLYCPQSDRPNDLSVSGYLANESHDFTSVLFRGTSASIKLSSDAVDVTTWEAHYFQNSFTENTQVLKQLTISFSTLLIPEHEVPLLENIAEKPIGAEVYFYFGTNEYLRISGYFVITDYSIDASVDGVAEVSLDMSALSDIGILRF